MTGVVVNVLKDGVNAVLCNYYFYKFFTCFVQLFVFLNIKTQHGPGVYSVDKRGCYNDELSLIKYWITTFNHRSAPSRLTQSI